MWGVMDSMTTKLEFARKACESTRLQKLVNNIKPFIKREVLLAGLALGIGAAPIILSAPRAQDTKQEQVQGQKLPVMQLEKSLAQLEKETAKMAIYNRPMSDGQKFTCQSTSVQTNDVNFIVNIEKMELGVLFDHKKDNPTPALVAGNRAADLTGFANLVEKQTGKRLEGVKIILDTGSVTYNGKTVSLTDAYVIPIDSQGKITTGLGNGKILIYGISYYADVVKSNPVILLEPNSQYTLSLAIR
jgi:hypothetical protein